MTHNKLLQVAGAAALGGFLFGFDVAVINGTVGSFSQAATGFDLSSAMTGWVVAIVSLGAAIGAALAGSAANRFGRVKVMVTAAVLFAISALMSGLSFSVGALLFWRFIGGLGVGISAVIAPAYIAEIAPADKRGRLGTLQQLAIAFGIFGAFISNFLLVKITGSADAKAWFGLYTWRWMFITELFPAVLYGFFVLFLPESPRYLVQIGKEAEAEKILAAVGADADPQGRITEIHASLSGHKPRFSDLLGGSFILRPVVWVALAFASLIQMAGINNVLLYATVLWESVGFTGNTAVFIPVLTSVIGIVMTIIGMLVIDRVGRRPLLLWGAIGMFISMLIAALTFMQGEVTPDGILNLNGIWVPLALTSVHMVYIIFCGTWGVVLWVFLGEIFPNQIRTAGLGLAIAGNWIGGTLVTQLFPVFKEHLGLSGTYFSYAVVAALLIWLVVRYIPETKGIELEDMSYTLNKSA
ncbi:Myo-inositol facilitator 1 [Corynebacterium kutscheri]|uniref:sugar porter family MFS transporter n=1 Tax=Corynebacterium kutscheri TaxID=35755 RepID=UPI000F6C782E|nr:sugar porter family MFS transporter [Corynebacterium kutscheri]VEH80247.1 Myo-inositol facilitator 1 [Corynebacterium kutscheri]